MSALNELCIKYSRDNAKMTKYRAVILPLFISIFIFFQTPNASHAQSSGILKYLNYDKEFLLLKKKESEKNYLTCADSLSPVSAVNKVQADNTLRIAFSFKEGDLEFLRNLSYPFPIGEKTDDSTPHEWDEVSRLLEKQQLDSELRIDMDRYPEIPMVLDRTYKVVPLNGLVPLSAEVTPEIFDLDPEKPQTVIMNDAKKNFGEFYDRILNGTKQTLYRKIKKGAQYGTFKNNCELPKSGRVHCEASVKFVAQDIEVFWYSYWYLKLDDTGKIWDYYVKRLKPDQIDRLHLPPSRSALSFNVPTSRINVDGAHIVFTSDEPVKLMLWQACLDDPSNGGGGSGGY